MDVQAIAGVLMRAFQERLASHGPEAAFAVDKDEMNPLVKGAPAGRRAHLDRLVAALWPARADTRAAYSRALAQRNALLARVRAGVASRLLAKLPSEHDEKLR